MCLLENNGICHESEIAKEILLRDQSQIEYYTKITNNMVGRILRNHKIVQKEKYHYRLNGFENLTKEQIEELVDICTKKLDDYLERRGSNI